MSRFFRGRDGRIEALQPPLTIYLQDHYAGASAGLHLARRALDENHSTRYEPILLELALEIAEDRRALRLLMTRLDLEPSRVKEGIAWMTERLGRLKLNGRVTGYSPLSRLLELEWIAAGIAGKRALWLALAELDEPSLHDLELLMLAERATSQLERLEPWRLEAAAEALR
ncbi:MAG TPA: hypothetical protein VG265_10290 [Gaiellaceae bacterium]|nr:hypothetical protein [Gaiellaceae bacterium]